MIEHKQTAILNPASNMIIEVDEGIAPLLQIIWNCGIITTNSCQENKPGIIWIEFLAAEDAEAFLTRVVSGLDPINNPKADNWLYSRIMGANGSWQYTAHPHDAREYIDEEDGCIGLNANQSCSIALSISIRFPMDDYEKLRDILEGKKTSLINAINKIKEPK
ncbi:MAG: hypothetical protein QG575_535 [Euryarchaeota archaeon]|nr:hypothetical protein [Euryarchaeota archaeon]